MGKFSTIGSSTCWDCMDGYFGNTTGLTSSECSGKCTGGFYCPYSGSTSSTAFSCPGGFECPPGTASIKDSNMCMPGNYSKNESIFCSACSPGYYSPYNQSTYCMQCENGYSSDFGSSYCYLITLSPEERIFIVQNKTFNIIYIALGAIIAFYSIIFCYCGKIKFDSDQFRHIQWVKYPFAAAIIEKLSLEVMSPEDPEDPILGVSRAFLNAISSIVELIHFHGINIEDENTLTEDEYEAIADFVSEKIKRSVNLFPVRWYVCFNFFGFQRFSLEPIRLEKIIPDIAKDVANCIKTKTIPNVCKSNTSDSTLTTNKPVMTDAELARREAKREIRRQERIRKKNEMAMATKNDISSSV